jgi:hypothetical protein
LKLKRKSTIELEHIPTTENECATEIEADSDQSNETLRLIRQSDPCIVYQRIVKPFPTLALSTKLARGDYTVDATLINRFCESRFSYAALFVFAKSRSCDEEVDRYLWGTKRVLISASDEHHLVVFKRLKILITSQQAGSLFRLKFLLKQGNTIIASVLSSPIEVVSHSQYLKGSSFVGSLVRSFVRWLLISAAREPAIAAPLIEHVVPNCAAQSSPIAIVGRNLEGCSVLLDNAELKPLFSSASVIIVPAPSAEGRVALTVTNSNLTSTRAEITVHH